MTVQMNPDFLHFLKTVEECSLLEAPSRLENWHHQLELLSSRVPSEHLWMYLVNQLPAAQRAKEITAAEKFGSLV